MLRVNHVLIVVYLIVWSPQKMMGRDVKVFRMRSFLVLSLVPSPCDDYTMVSMLHQVIQQLCAVDSPLNTQAWTLVLAYLWLDSCLQLA